MAKDNSQTHSYIDAVESGVIQLESMYSTYLDEMVSISEHIREKIERFSAPSEAPTHVHLDNSLSMIRVMLKYKCDVYDPRIVDIARLSPYYEWLINHEVYNYDEFDVKWFEESPTAFFFDQMQDSQIIKSLFKEYIEKNLETSAGRQLTSLYLKYFDKPKVIEK